MGYSPLFTNYLVCNTVTVQTVAIYLKNNVTPYRK